MFRLKLAKGATVLRLLLVGERYGSDGDNTMLLAIGVAGGKLKTDQRVLSTSAAAIVARRVDMAAVMVSQPSSQGLNKEQVIHERERVKCYPCDKDLEHSHQ